MTDSTDPTLLRVTHRFDAAAERVYDAFLDPERASRFLFTNGAGSISRCEIDARVGGRFTIVDHRQDGDIEHVGEYLELDRPRRIVFRFAVPQFSPNYDRITIEITPLRHGCELVLTHELRPEDAKYEQGARQGWTNILDMAAVLLAEDAPTCGIGVAQHATISQRLGTMFEGLAETLALHRRMLKLDDEASRREDEVYAELATRWREIAERVTAAASLMAAQRELPMGAHDESAWGDEHLRAFEKLVTAQTQAFALLRIAAPRDQAMLASMKAPPST